MAPKQKKKGKSWSCTDMATVDFSHTWTIKNFPLLKNEIGNSIQSSYFSSGVKGDGDKWCIELFPKGDIEANKNYIGLFLNLVTTKKPKIRANSIFSILDANGDRKKTLPSNHENIAEFAFDSGNWGYAQFIESSELKNRGFLTNGNLTILCEVTVISDILVASQNDPRMFIVPENELSNDISTLFENPKLSDVIVSVNGQEFQAHKLILSARSSVFSAMFEHPLQENKCSRVEITDVNHNVMQEMLRFIYTGKVSNIEEIADDLLFAADKYDLGTLKCMCEEVLGEQLTVENAAETLVLAFRHNAKELEEQTVDFILKHVTEVMKTPGWKSMTDLNSCVGMDALQTLLRKACRQ